MSGVRHEAEVTRGELTKAGWRQGALFSLPTAHLVWNSLAGESAEPGVATIDYAEVAADELLVVASQDCDLDARGATEPYVEVLVCRITSSANILRAARRNSSRWFLIDGEHGLVAYAMDRLQIDKRVLRALTPQPWPSTDEHFTWYRRWLARRYDRPAIPDAVVNVFQRPVNARMDRLEKQQPDILAAFNAVVSELRISLPSSEVPPFHIDVLLLTECLKISEAEAHAVDHVTAELERALDPSEVIVEKWQLLHPEEISLAQYFATRPLLYDYLTYQGEEVVGAEPPAES